MLVSKVSGVTEIIKVSLEVTSHDIALNYIKAFLPAIAIGISAFVGYKVATSTVKSQRAIARKRATIDVILKLESEPTYQSSLATFKDLRDSNKLLQLLENNKSSRDTEALLDILSIINHYEIICCGIVEDTLDEIFYFQWYRGAFLKHWNQLEPFIVHLRNQKNGNKRVAIRYELFAKTWNDNKFVTIKSSTPEEQMKNHIVKNKQDC